MFRLHSTTYVFIRWWRCQMVTLEHLEMVWKQDWWFSSMRWDDQVSQRSCDIPAALWPHREAAASARGMETKCGSGLAQRCVEAAGKIPHSMPHMYLLQRPDDEECKKPLWEPLWPSGAVSPSRCESKKSTFRSLTRYLPICVWVNPCLLGWPSSILRYYKCFLDLILGSYLVFYLIKNHFWGERSNLDHYLLCLLDRFDH